MADRQVTAELKQDVSQVLTERLETAAQHRASDLHFEPGIDTYRIRMRVDGYMHILESGPMALHGLLINRLKILSGMDITERRMPQDGGFSLELQGQAVDFRVSILPVADGEKAAVRILNARNIELDPESLGIRENQWNVLQSFLRAKHGLLIFTGPTGSGKTTSMYTLLQQLNQPHRNIVTLEDPIEYRLPGINQIQVNERAKLGFSNGLRAILRQDPEVIMVGEIRDTQTAEIAVRAAITGHLVLSTLHTNDSHGAITRLMDMGIEPYLIAASLTGVCSQRLVRTLCSCKNRRSIREEEMPVFSKYQIGSIDEVYDAAGCEACHGGYRGRTALLEILPITETVRTGILRKDDTDALKRLTPDFAPLIEDGLYKVVQGDTTLQEVLDAVHN